MTTGWQSCAEVLGTDGLGPLRCWNPPAPGGIGLCPEHARRRLLEEECRLTRVFETIRAAIADMQRHLEGSPPLDVRRPETEPRAPVSDDRRAA
jgi:hypothetical protein